NIIFTTTTRQLHFTNAFGYIFDEIVGVNTSTPSENHELSVAGNAIIDGILTVDSCVGCGGGGNPFNQWLDTTSSPRFASTTLTYTDGYYASSTALSVSKISEFNNPYVDFGAIVTLEHQGSKNNFGDA